MCSSAVEQTIYSNQRASEAASAGFILLAIICVSEPLSQGLAPNLADHAAADHMGLLLRLSTTS